jgi:hypothetical protein
LNSDELREQLDKLDQEIDRVTRLAATCATTILASDASGRVAPKRLIDEWHQVEEELVSLCEARRNLLSKSPQCNCEARLQIAEIERIWQRFNLSDTTTPSGAYRNAMLYVGGVLGHNGFRLPGE